ncbi:MAG: polyprenyl synthetase family protein [Spirochaetia bacterium]|nr:polyprenyl synthetase family protein [Spirochaetia bacterium]
MDREPGHILSDLAACFEAFLKTEVTKFIQERAVPELAAPVLYSLSAGGKRIRPALCLAGMTGMVCGQALDLAAERKAEQPGRSRDALLLEIHQKKTGAMFGASAEMGAVLSGADRESYRQYGIELGLLFQMTDDLLDETGDAAVLGKTTGKDRDAGKLTYTLLYGLDQTRRLCQEKAAHVKELARRLETGTRARADYQSFFVSLPDFITERVK